MNFHGLTPLNKGIITSTFINNAHTQFRGDFKTDPAMFDKNTGLPKAKGSKVLVWEYVATVAYNPAQQTPPGPDRILRRLDTDKKPNKLTYWFAEHTAVDNSSFKSIEKITGFEQLLATALIAHSDAIKAAAEAKTAADQADRAGKAKAASAAEEREAEAEATHEETLRRRHTDTEELRAKARAPSPTRTDGW